MNPATPWFINEAAPIGSGSDKPELAGDLRKEICIDITPFFLCEFEVLDTMAYDYNCHGHIANAFH